MTTRRWLTFRKFFDWIAKDNPRAADALVASVFDKVERLSAPELSHMGRPGVVDGTRELIEGPYIIVYKVFDDGKIVILTIVHGARDRRENETQ